MEMPAEVMIHNAILGLKGNSGLLLRIDPQGFYEVNLKFGEKRHRTLLPIHDTVLIQRDPEDEEVSIADLEIER